MNHVRARSIWRIGAPSRRAGQVSRRSYANEIPPQPTPPHTPASPPNPNAKPPSRVGAYYKSFSYPVLKSFLIALLTYQLAYYGWLKLETIEETHFKSTEISDLQAQLREVIEKQKAKAGDVVDEVKDKIIEYTQETKEAGRAVVESVREGKEEVEKTADAVGKVASGGWWPW
ncbi:hypothetical protein CC86DRAFT_313162 [Ophiobolus disseminans]|uniref:Uncharacterized protein n=1 Tax=Ophiobolus disseminans TaxID=1469910 RepID=A0A6A7AI39_9PLEO|nr:hypothetical protein CC86DRAFT_313162 [Ophiobolus disseminans]